jgi:hypothetical protein
MRRVAAAYSVKPTLSMKKTLGREIVKAAA